MNCRKVKGNNRLRSRSISRDASDASDAKFFLLRGEGHGVPIMSKEGHQRASGADPPSHRRGD